MLAARPLGEADRIAVLLTAPYGKLTCKVKGARKAKSKLRAATEPTTLLKCQLVEGRGLATLTQVEVLSSFPALRADFRRLMSALLVLEVVDALCYKGQPGQVPFELTVAGLETLQTSDTPVQVAHSLILDLLAEWGAALALFNCPICGRNLEGAVYFSPAAGGLTCVDCAKAKGARQFQSAEFCAYFQQLARHEYSLEVPSEVVKDAHLALQRYLEHYVERRLKGFKVLVDTKVL